MLPIAQQLAARLVAGRVTIAVAESSAGGLISAALLAVPGASAYFLGGAVVYTRQSRRLLLGIPDAAMDAITPATEAYAALLAETVRLRFGADWGIGETGATGPTGSRYGYAAGHACLAVAGPSPAAVTLETGHGRREANMRAFARAALELLGARLGG